MPPLPPSTLERDPVHEALLAHLELTGRPVGDGSRPETETLPWLVLWSIAGGSRTGPPLSRRSFDVAYVFQIDAVGGSRAQAQRTQDRVRRLLVERRTHADVLAPLEVPGVGVMDVDDDGSPDGPRPDGTVWVVPGRYRVTVTPT